ncbi:type II toxin-antitoxin system RelE/ParE family toxin [Sulfurimonas hydrogeniphila]|uniref:type II toxin-antitoxin system RelE/ParE family toxin n=1 Tax=Sulfurimonas hydrogeniphila TaxID=2509341 RepID=UPI00125FF738|nr:type II toxin-antitoxin system RelE/ParE family toxin [Sulfurimonas hydrogeniphila]
MKIIYEPRFINSFNNIWDYIAQDNKNRANQFKKGIKKLIEDIHHMPYKCRKSIYFDDDNIRDLIYKGYKVDEEKSIITVLGIKKYKAEL